MNKSTCKQRRSQHSRLPAERNIGCRSSALVGRPRFGRKGHSDSELAAKPNPCNCPVSKEVPIALRKRTQAGESREPQDRPIQDANTSVTIAQWTGEKASGNGSYESPGYERPGFGRGKLKGRRERHQDEAQDQKIESIHRIAKTRSDHCPARVGVDLRWRQSWMDSLRWSSVRAMRLKDYREAHRARV